MTEGRRRRLLGSLALLVATTAVPATSHAGATDAEVQSRLLYMKGEKMADAGSWNEACPLFQAAHDLHGTGGTALRTADCYEKIGKYDRALLLYIWIVDHKDLDRNAERVTLAEGRVAALRKQLELDKPLPLPGPQPAEPAPKPPGPRPHEAPPSLDVVWLSFAVGVAGIGTGAVTGILSLNKVSELKAQCPSKDCPTNTTLGPVKDSAVLLGNISTGTFVVGGVGLALGGVLLGVLLPRVKAAEQQGRVKVNLGLGSVDVQGRF